MWETLNQIRTKGWIIKPRNYIRRYIKKCVICNRYEGNPFQYPETLDCHSAGDKFALTCNAVDYEARLYVNNIYGKLPTYKCWIVLFNCATTRYVYLDLVPDCSTSSCVHLLKRFFTARGVTTLIISDNGSQFISNETQSFGTKWQFHLPNVPWWGGIFERMIRYIKRCLKKLLGWSRVNYEELHILLAEMQTVLNNRLLTSLYDKPAEEVLTPNHLLFGRKINLESILKSISFSNKDLNKCSKLHNLLEHFRNIWLPE